MNKVKIISFIMTFAMLIPLLLQSVAALPADTENVLPQENETEDAQPERSPDDPRFGLSYSDEILQTYEDMSNFMSERGAVLEISVDDFAACYEGPDTDYFSLYCNVPAEISGETQDFSNNTSPVSTNSVDITNKYYYNIGLSAPTTADYSKYNIRELAQKGDIIFDDQGFFGITGHAAIVEGKYYSSSCGYYIRVIETISSGTCRGLIDATRADERGSYLYKVFTATPAQKEAAVEFCVNQLGKPWGTNFTHEYAPGTNHWICSQVIWAAYKNQGVDIECNGGDGGDIGVTPKDITVNSTMVTHVDMRCNLNTVSNGEYYLTNSKSGHRLDIRGGTPVKSAQIQQYVVGDYPEQKWNFTYHSDGRYYVIRSNITDNGPFYLDVASPATGAHAKVKLWGSYSNPEEKWFIQKDGPNTYRFINGYSGLCMDITGGSTELKAEVQVYPYKGTADQKWMLSRCGTKYFENGTYYITNQKSGLRLDIRGGTPAKSVQIQQSAASTSSSQKWKIEWDPYWSCYYVMCSNTSNGLFFLDVASPSTGAHAKVKLWNVNTRPEERWVLLPTGGSTYRFINGYDNLCMDITGGSTASGADVQVYPYVFTDDQKWTLQKIS